MANMNEENYRLYAGKEIFYFSTFEDAQSVAKEFMVSKVELRIEILVELEPFEADFWAYEYENNQWAPS